jgi:hypothetical protein
VKRVQELANYAKEFIQLVLFMHKLESKCSLSALETVVDSTLNESPENGGTTQLRCILSKLSESRLYPSCKIPSPINNMFIVELKIAKALIHKLISRVDTDLCAMSDSTKKNNLIEESYNEVLILHVKLIEIVDDKLQKFEFYK